MKQTLLACAVCAAMTVVPTARAEDLLESYGLARAGDPVLLAADANRKSVSEGIAQAKAAFLPSPNVDVTYVHAEGDSSTSQLLEAGGFGQRVASSNSDDRDITLSARQTIYDHANYTRLRSARSQAARSDADYDAAVDNLAIRVAEAYFGVLTASDSLAFAQAEEKAVGRQLEQAEQRFNVGLTAITDVHEARARHDSSTAAVILAENALDDAQVGLSEITGKFSETIAPLKEELPLDRPDPIAWQDWVDLALKNNPTLAALEFAAEAADHNIDTARAAHLPNLFLTGRYNDSRTLGGSIVNGSAFPGDGDSDGFSVGVTLNIPLDASGAVRSQVRQATFNHELALDNLETQRRSVTRQTRNAYRAVLAGISEVQARRQALISAQSALEATEAGFEVGTRTIVDVLLSQQVLFQAQRDYSQSRHNFILNGLRLRRAAGVIEEADVARINTLLAAQRPILQAAAEKEAEATRTERAATDD